MSALSGLGYMTSGLTQGVGQGMQYNNQRQMELANLALNQRHQQLLENQLQAQKESEEAAREEQTWNYLRNQMDRPDFSARSKGEQAKIVAAFNQVDQKRQQRMGLTTPSDTPQMDVPAQPGQTTAPPPSTPPGPNLTHLNSPNMSDLPGSSSNPVPQTPAPTGPTSLPPGVAGPPNPAMLHNQNLADNTQLANDLNDTLGGAMVPGNPNFGISNGRVAPTAPLPQAPPQTPPPAPGTSAAPQQPAPNSGPLQLSPPGSLGDLLYNGALQQAKRAQDILASGDLRGYQAVQPGIDAAVHSWQQYGLSDEQLKEMKARFPVDLALIRSETGKNTASAGLMGAEAQAVPENVGISRYNAETSRMQTGNQLKLGMANVGLGYAGLSVQQAKLAQDASQFGESMAIQQRAQQLQQAGMAKELAIAQAKNEMEITKSILSGSQAKTYNVSPQTGIKTPNPQGSAEYDLTLRRMRLGPYSPSNFNAKYVQIAQDPAKLRQFYAQPNLTPAQKAEMDRTVDGIRPITQDDINRATRAPVTNP